MLQLKTAAILMSIIVALLTGFTCIAAEDVAARANISDYLYSAPNSWEPVGYNVNGTAAHQVVDTLGWSKIKITGNVGIGNGSMQALNDSTTPAGNYTDSYLMGVDISVAPIDKSRLGSASPASPASAGQMRVNDMGQFNNGSISFGRAIKDTYHPIHAGNPVNDMQYQHPCSTNICDCAMLRGLPVPGGDNASICIRCLGYGY